MIQKSDDISAGKINECIANMLKTCNRECTNGYVTQFKLIKNSFDKNGVLLWVDIATRLSLIDLYYTTNFNRFAEFGLEGLTDSIWNLCSDTQGNHTDAAFVKRIESFVSDCCSNPQKARESDLFYNLFDPSNKFGITQVVQIEEGKECVGHSAQSLISKYLFFLLETHHSEGNTLGFPIFDSIALDLQGPLYKKLGGVAVPGRDMVRYINKMAFILNCLRNSTDINNSVWTMPTSVCNTQFGLLDYFLWRIGKSGKFSFSLLWSKDEKLKHYISAHSLHNETSQNPERDFQSLPKRFQQWHTVYASIKEKSTLSVE